MIPGQISYALVTPMRNEMQMLNALFGSVYSQSVRPILWVVVDDGSTDGSAEKARELAGSESWILVIDRANHDLPSWYRYGASVAFGVDRVLGLVSTTQNPAQLVGVLDADTVVDCDYFERLARGMESSDGFGIATGLVTTEGENLSENRLSPRGCARVYRMRLITEINGFPVTPAPDTVLQIKALHRGYTILVDQGARGIHRRSSSATRDTAGFRSLGLSHYSLGTDPFDALLITIMIMVSSRARNAAGFFSGYIEGLSHGYPRVNDVEIKGHFSSAWIRFFRSEETRQSVRNLFRPWS